MRRLGDIGGKLLNHQLGATAIEYALIASLISVAAVVSFETLGDTVENRYSAIDQTLDGVLSASGGASKLTATWRSSIAAIRARKSLTACVPTLPCSVLVASD